jgi:hypothetical protein
MDLNADDSFKALRTADQLSNLDPDLSYRPSVESRGIGRSTWADEIVDVLASHLREDLWPGVAELIEADWGQVTPIEHVNRPDAPGSGADRKSP